MGIRVFPLHNDWASHFLIIGGAQVRKPGKAVILRDAASFGFSSFIPDAEVGADIECQFLGWIRDSASFCQPHRSSSWMRLLRDSAACKLLSRRTVRGAHEGRQRHLSPLRDSSSMGCAHLVILRCTSRGPSPFALRHSISFNLGIRVHPLSARQAAIVAAIARHKSQQFHKRR